MTQVAQDYEQNAKRKAERLLLKQMLDTSPKLKEVIDGLIDNPNPELKDVIAPVIQAQIEDARKVRYSNSAFRRV